MSNLSKVHQGRWKILDWAGNDKTPYFGLFESLEDAADAIAEYAYEKLGEDCTDLEFEEFVGEYQYIIVEEDAK